MVVYLRYRSRELSRGHVNFRLLYIDVLQVTSESRGHSPIESPLLAAIESANREVREALNPESASSKRKRKKPHVYSPHERQRAESGKLAVDIGGLFYSDGISIYYISSFPLTSKFLSHKCCPVFSIYVKTAYARQN